MSAKSRLSFRTNPVSLLSLRVGSLRAMFATAMADKDAHGSAEHVHHSSREKEKGAVNARLVFACITFCAASFMFGYDDKLISPVAALPGFVSYQPILRRRCLTSLLGGQIPRTKSSHRPVDPHGAPSEFGLFAAVGRRCPWRPAGIAIEFPFRSQVASGRSISSFHWRRTAASVCAESGGFCEWSVC